ncbi:MAG: glycosyltransferase family 4 protein [Kiritimatiellaeota bacterium]|nr:glycosyltransferase family 4 protein [Kiritimatiellota bacterium]
MDFSHLNIGIIHSLVGKNDGVSIVIDQSVTAMTKYMGVSIGNIHYLAAHASQRLNTTTDDVFWHKNPINKAVVANFTASEFPKGLEREIEIAARRAKELIADFAESNNIDLIFAHNISHPYNFITALGLNLYLEERAAEHHTWPKVIAWWHDSYFERPVFDNPNPRIKAYLKHLPGILIDGVVFINEGQTRFLDSYLRKRGRENRGLFMSERTAVIPNTSEITWDWRIADWNSPAPVAPPLSNYNDSFFKDIGVVDSLDALGASMDDAVFLLQHTRVVPRKRIELALELAFKVRERKPEKVVVLLVSGHSGDEQSDYLRKLKKAHAAFSDEYRTDRVLLVFGESRILPHREIIVDKKYYAFDEIPAIIAAKGGLGTYFSEIEGFGNNLLEMMSAGLPVVINRYDVYKKYIERYGFNLPGIDDCVLDARIVDEAITLLDDIPTRNATTRHNLAKLAENLGHEVISEKLIPLVANIFFKSRI